MLSFDLQESVIKLRVCCLLLTVPYRQLMLFINLMMLTRFVAFTLLTSQSLAGHLISNISLALDYRPSLDSHHGSKISTDSTYWTRLIALQTDDSLRLERVLEKMEFLIDTFDFRREPVHAFLLLSSSVWAVLLGKSGRLPDHFGSTQIFFRCHSQKVDRLSANGGKLSQKTG